MEIKYDIKFLPKKEANLDVLLAEVNAEFENLFIVSGKFISLKDSVSNLDDETANKLKLFSKEKECHFVLSWISDDINKAGIDFYDYERGDSYSFESNLGAKSVDIIPFLVLCGASSYLSEVLFYGV